VEDIALAARENYRSVEHLKRYTTTGMGTDQGKTSNINALVQMGVLTGRTPHEVGTTKFRPPYKPVTLNLLACGRSGLRLRPGKRLPAHDWHAQHGAIMEEFGAWQRPAYYPQSGESMEQAAQREAYAVRQRVAIFDGSPLGKIEVHGPDAGAFLDWMYVGTMSTLKTGQARYGALVSETGVLIDDGIVARLSDDLFWVNTSSGGAERIALHLEDWLQRDLMHLRASVTPVTSQWANLTLAGPLAWNVLKDAGLPEKLAPQSMAHMTMQTVHWKTYTLRVMRASFSGELGYELNVPAEFAAQLYDAVWAAGQTHGICLYGVEALQILRIEKGFIHVGTESDRATLPDDMGLLRLPIKKVSDFAGRRSLSLPVATDPQRQQLVGLVPVDGQSALPVGAHITDAPPPSLSQGFVTSSCFSPVLGHPIALARLVRGRSRTGETVKLFNMGQWVQARVVLLPFYDPQGERLHAH
jgi:sarcosine oxidase subunit alpha